MTNRRDVNTFFRTIISASIAMVPPTAVFTNTAKLPIETVKRLISAVARRPNLWMRNHNGQKRSDINILWYEVSQEVHLPVDICRIKWGHLRDNFRKVFIRNTLSDEPPTTWRFYNDMRFMETSVAENVMRQSRLKDENRFWPQEMQQKHFPIFQSHNPAAIAACATLPHPHLNLRENFNHEQPQLHQFDFSMPSLFNNHDNYQNKRIKLENDTQSMSSSNKDNSRCSDIKNENSVSLMSDDYTHAINDNNDDDDEFDEDAATEETDRDNNNETDGTSHIENRGIKNNKGDIYTIELFDDDDDDADDDTEDGKCSKLPILSGGECGDAKPCNFNKITLNSSIKPESTPTSTNRKNDSSLEQDADRMFLLSLLPFLQKVNGQRKLHVRQKLQNVLIDEFG